MLSNPPYFQKYSPEAWDVLAFLRENHVPQTSQRARERHHSRMVDIWVRSLKAIIKDSKDEESLNVAKQLLARYKVGDGGRPSDKSRVSKWFRKANRANQFHGDNFRIYQGPVLSSKVIGNSSASVRNQINSPQDHSQHDPPFSLDSEKIPSVVDSQEVLRSTSPLSSERSDCSYSTFAPSPGPSVSHASPTSQCSDDFQCFKSKFFDRYQQMSTDSKFLFPSTGRYAEDIIAGKLSQLSAECLPHSWILPLDDITVRNWFLPQELVELEAILPALPQPDNSFTYSLSRFENATTESDFLEILHTVPYCPPGETLDYRKHRHGLWVNDVVSSMLSLLARPDLLSCPSLKEGWYDSNIWCFLIDRAYLLLHDVVVQRKEIKPQALDLEQQQQQQRCDGVIRTLDPNPLEIGAAEVSKCFGKWQQDGDKLAKVLHAMLFRLGTIIDFDPAIFPKLQTIGYLCAAYDLQILRLVPVNRNFSVFVRGQLRQVPVTPSKLPEILDIINSIHLSSRILQSSISLINSFLKRPSTISKGGL